MCTFFPSKAAGSTHSRQDTTCDSEGQSAGQVVVVPHPQYRVLYDPTRKCLYQRELVLPAEGESLSMTLRDAKGEVIEVQVPCASRTWDATYPWPARYADPGPPTPNLYTDILKMALIPLRELSKTALFEKAGSRLAGNIPPEVMTGDFVNPRTYLSAGRRTFLLRRRRFRGLLQGVRLRDRRRDVVGR